jgi:hypothetical protein
MASIAKCQQTMSDFGQTPGAIPVRDGAFGAKRVRVIRRTPVATNPHTIELPF